MIEKAMSYIHNLTVQGQYAQHEVIDGILYHKKPGGALERIKRPGIQASERVTTLSGLADLLNGTVDEETLGPPSGWLIHVASPTQVIVMSSLGRTNPGEREVYALAEIKHEHFRYNAFLDQESFIIGMLASFQHTDDWANVMTLVGNLRGERVRTDEDDGFTQVATVKQGSKMVPVEVKNPVTLRPYRTFYDVEQPAGQYVVRLKQDADNVPTIALFDVKDGQWQHEAMGSIAGYLSVNCEGFLVVS